MSVGVSGTDTYLKQSIMKHDCTVWDMLKDSLKNKKSIEPHFNKKHNSAINIIKFRIFGIRPNYDPQYVNEILQIDSEVERIKRKNGENTPVRVIDLDKCTRLICSYVDGRVKTCRMMIFPPGSEWHRTVPKTFGEALKYIVFCKYNFLMCFKPYDR